VPFQDTPNKSTIRDDWDLALIKGWHAKVDRPLAYFGLPGPDILDLLKWGDYLGTRTGVESPGRTSKQRRAADEVIGRLHMNVMAHEIGSGFQLLEADVEDVIINAVDTNGVAPVLNDGRPAHLAHFRYDIVNLDFNSGLDYRRKDGARRVAALKKLFERQEGHSFLLFLTVSVRDTLDDQIEQYLRELQGRDRGPGWRDLIEWYLGRGGKEKAYKLKGVVPSFVQSVAESRMFRCVSRPPITYHGHRTQMVHFAFELESRDGYLRALSEQDDRDLIELPLLRCECGELKLARQHPGFDGSRLEASLDFLPPELRDPILSQLPAAFEEAG
jgi:hypothetical protein